MEIQSIEESFGVVGKSYHKGLIVFGLLLGFFVFGWGGYYLGTHHLVSQSQTSSEKTTIAVVSPMIDQEDSDSLCGIDKVRLSKPTIYGDKQYFIYTRNSMNVVFPSGNKNYLESGMFVIQNDETANCRKLIEVFDESAAKNNIYEMYSSDNSLYVMAVDQFGAGSGEGNAKILKSDDDGATWEVKYCFYYSPEEKLTIKDIISDAHSKVKLLSLDNPYCRDFILGLEGGNLK
ncbi:MAG: hypothetical protein WC657_08250 [Candidatus Paceibacterota bacterium]|jgi:hypothetical protein